SGSRRVNFGKDSCTGAPNPNFVDGTSLGGREGCSYDYVAGSQIYPKADKQSLLGRFTAQLHEDHQVFVELMLARAQTDYAASPATARFRTSSGITLPKSLQDVTGITGAVDFRFRLEDAGQRTSRVESDASRLVLGATGTVAGWDYDTALSQSTNKATDTDLSGWVSLSKLEAGLQAGSYNPFVKPADRSAGQAFMNAIRLDGAARISKGTSTSIDGKMTRAIGELAGGDLMLALGAEFRKEKTEFRATDVLKSNDVNNDRSSSGDLLADSNHSRNVAGQGARVRHTTSPISTSTAA
ncbi:MAG: hypothetical protein EBR58_09280, partial [Betaproteobacteria bacterium]|nr:hypothetical protein [Betaproteobacteria bacterium]